MALDEIRILIAENDRSFAHRMERYLTETGFRVKVINTDFLLKKNILEWSPRFLFIDLLFSRFYAQQCLEFIKKYRNNKKGQELHVIVTSTHSAEANVKSCLQAGADDFLIKPVEMIEVLKRLSLLCRSKKGVLGTLNQITDQGSQKYMNMASLLTQTLNQNKNPSILRFEVTQMLSLALKAVRVSVLDTQQASENKIKVLASSDDPYFSGVNLDLKNYPEIEYTHRTQKILFIESLKKNLVMAPIQKQVKSIDFDSMLVLPLIFGFQSLGVLSVRMPKQTRVLDFYQLKLAEIAAQILAATWTLKNPSRKKIEKAS